jgi:hypothetical protein
MTQPTTLQDLRDLALGYADMEESDFASVDLLDRWINTGLGKLHDLLVNSYSDYYRKTQTITLVAGQEEYDLPDDFLKSMEVFYEVSNRRYNIPRFSRGQIDGYRQGALVGGTVTHWYTPQVVRLTQPSDKVDLTVPFTWEDYVALVAAARLLVKEESDPSAVMAIMKEEEMRIIDMAEPRDEGDQGRVEDVYGRFNRAADHFREWRYLRYRIMGKKMHFFEFEYLGT